MSMFESNNVEVITFHYLCENPNLIAISGHKIFKNRSISLLFKIIKEFTQRYGSIPQMGNTTQIREVAVEDADVLKFNPAKQPEENINEFMSIADGIMSHPMNQYAPEYITKSAEGYLRYRFFEEGLQTTINFFDGSKPNSDNIDGIVTRAQNIFLTQTTIQLHEERPINFWSPSAHIQTQTNDLIPCGWKTLNRFLNGGFERKTLTHFWSAPNGGKTLFLGSIGRDVSILGKNVFIASLEMAPQKYSKRMGSSIFDVPMSLYAKNDSESYWRQKITDFKNGDDYPIVPGALWIQRFTHASPITITMAADRLAKELNLKWDLVIYDYLGEMESSRNFSMENMYALHKTNNGEIFDHAVQFNWAAITAHQVMPDAYDKDEMSLKSSAEGRGISHRTDNIFGIIQDATMFSYHKFFLKALKARDNEFKNWHMRLNIDWNTMKLSDDEYPIEPGKNLTC